MTIHPMFHVLQLRRAIGTSIASERGVRNVGGACGSAGFTDLFSSSSGGVDLLGGLPDSEAIWEPFEMIQQQFPKFHLEDNVTFRAGVLINPQYVLIGLGPHWERVSLSESSQPFVLLNFFI